MRIKSQLFFLVFGLWSVSAMALSPVRDEVLITTDRTCAIHFLTHDNTTGWYLTEVEGACPNGVLEGAGLVTVRNAFGKTVGQLNGFFHQGYWVGHHEVLAPLKTLLLKDETEQTLVVDLGKEERLDIKYLGKLTATRRSDNTYGPFSGCRPTQILAVTGQPDLFEDEAVQQELINSAINRAKNLCPDTEWIYFYASQSENPDNQEIVFFADINLESRKIKVRRLPSSRRNRDLLGDGSQVSAIPQPKEIRRETGLPVVQITPVKPEQERGVAVSSQPEVAKQPVPIPVQTIPVQTQSVSVVPEPEAQNTVSALENLDDIPALLTAARLLKQPIDGKALVRIHHFDEKGEAVLDEPIPLQATGKALSLGWGIAEGLFSYRADDFQDSEKRGFIQINTFTPVELPEKK